MDEKKLQELMKDEAFMKELVQLKTKDEVQELFKSKGVEFTLEELEEFEREGTKLLKNSDLEDVSGGQGGEALRDFALSTICPPYGLLSALIGAEEHEKEGRASMAVRGLVGAAIGTYMWVSAAKAGVKGIKYGVHKIKEKREQKKDL